MRDHSLNRLTRTIARGRALDFIKQKARPVLVGEVSLAIGSLWSLEETEELLLQMAEEKIIRKLTPEECRTRTHKGQEWFVGVTKAP